MRFHGLLLLLYLALVLLVVPSYGNKRKSKQELKNKVNKEQREKSLKDAKWKHAVLSASGGRTDDAGAFTSEIDEALSEIVQPNVDILGTPEQIQVAVASSSGYLKVGDECPKCPEVRSKIKLALNSFWSGDLYTAYSCSCSFLLDKPNDGLAQSIMYAVSQSRHAKFLSPEINVAQPKTDSSDFISWDVIGPFTCGKLEVDADPLLGQYRAQVDEKYINLLDDVALAIITMPDNITAISEIASGGKVGWKSYKSGKGIDVDVRWNVNWNEVANGVSSTAAYEFQGWARAITYVRSNGMYLLSCPGVHTAYIRNANITHVVAGDVYKTNRISSVVELKTGPVAIVLPLRGVGQIGFQCLLKKSSKPIELAPPRLVPNLLELKLPRADGRLAKNGEGIFLSSLFSLQMTNTLLHTVSVTFKVEAPRGLSGGSFYLQPAVEYNDPICFSYIRHTTKDFHSRCKSSSKASDLSVHTPPRDVVIASGQTILVPMELRYMEEVFPTGSKPDGSKNEEYVNGREEEDLTLTHNGLFSPVATKDVPSFSCRSIMLFSITAIPSRGEASMTQLEFKCRKPGESILFSYLDHDGSVSQAAFLFPISSSILPKFEETAVSGKFAEKATVPHAKQTSEVCYDLDGPTKRYCATSIDPLNNITDFDNPIVPSNDDIDRLEQSYVVWNEKTFAKPDHFPVLLSLHGTGTSAISQADAYKVKRSSGKDGKEFEFGINGLWVIAPSRHGAHNWEAVGEVSARASVSALKTIMSKYTDLPQVIDEVGGIIAGHSMGGHGAFLSSTLNPDRSVCSSIAAGWIRKEEYGNANNFFGLDVQNSFVEPDLKRILDICLSAFHPDKLVDNLHDMDTHIRVGSNDMTTHAWYSRRIHRLLKFVNTNSTLEEVHNRDHWWWDSKTENDGGVLNDKIMRKFYRFCKDRSVKDYPQLFLPDKDSLPGDVPVKQSPKCSKNLRLVVTDIPSQGSLCGMRVLQKLRQSVNSVVTQKCFKIDKSKIRGDYVDYLPEDFSYENLKSSYGIYGYVLVCSLHTANVKRLRVQLPFFIPTKPASFKGYSSIVHHSHVKTNQHVVAFKIDGVDVQVRVPPFDRKHDNTSISFIADEGAINGKYHYDEQGVAYIDLCWLKSDPEICRNAMEPLSEKVPNSHGPMRQLYSKKLVIVYGTPQAQELRTSIKTFAVYLANQIVIAHDTLVRVLSDVEYNTEVNEQKALLRFSENVIFIGGPKSNKVLRKLIRNDTILSNTVQAYIPVNFSLVSEDSADSGVEDYLDEFKLDQFVFEGLNDVAIFTFPIEFKSQDSQLIGRHARWVRESKARIAAVMVANSPEGYLRLSRLAAPTVPPMVRAPFANYIPDYMIIDESLWELGFGSVKLAGFWDSNWKFSSDLSYARSDNSHVLLFSR